jgi:hypothetical protein
MREGAVDTCGVGRRAAGVRTVIEPETSGSGPYPLLGDEEVFNGHRDGRYRNRIGCDLALARPALEPRVQAGGKQGPR